MDPQNFNPFNVAASSPVQHAVSEAPQTDEAMEFEHHLAEASQAAPVASRGPDYPYLSTEDLSLIDSAVAQYVARKNVQPATATGYSTGLRRLVNDLRRGGQTTDLADHKALHDHANTHFPKDTNVKRGVTVLREYHLPAYPHLTEEDRNLIDTVIAGYAAQQNLQPNTAKSYTRALRRLVNDLRRGDQMTDLADHKSLLAHLNTHFPNNGAMKTAVGVLRAYYAHAAHSRAGKRLRTLNDLEEVVLYPQPSANAASGGSSAAPQVASTGVIIRGSDKRPLYSEDAAAVVRLQQALIQGGKASEAARRLGSCLVKFSRWLFENNRPSIVARLDSKSLSDDGAIHRYPGASDANLLEALDYFRTLMTTGVVVPAPPGRPRAKLNPPPQNVPLINPETVALMEPLRIDDAGAQHSASQQANTRLEELQEEQDGQHAPSAFIQEQTAFQSEQLPQGELRRVLDHSGDQAMPSAVSDLSEELQLHDELHGLGDNYALSFPIDPEELTSDRELFSPDELLRPLDDEPAEELQDWLDGHPAPSPFIQAQAAFHAEQPPQGELRRVLDHVDNQAMPSAVSDPSEELRRLEKQLHDERHGLGDNYALSFPIDPEDFTSDRELFSPDELLRPDEPAEELQDWLDGHRASSPFIQAQAAFHSEQPPQGELRRVLDHLDDQAMPSAVSDPSEELRRLEKQLHDELHGLGGNQPALSFSIDPEDLTFDLDQFPPGELRRLLDDEPAEKLQAAFHSEQLPQGELERLLDHLDDQAMPSAVSDPSEELQERDDHPPV
ncbi:MULTISPECIES: hypothetical protein [Bradyrhizobium]|uniref:hypothetical protein n=1 Tax=Bradyrhizobium TaxID=374 RepID=UPI001FEE8D8D|nr:MULTISPECIES: hypothetical protein [Bradyrhizobium]